MSDSTRLRTYHGGLGQYDVAKADLPLDETALQAAEKVAGEHAFSTNSYNRLLISTYLRGAGFEMETRYKTMSGPTRLYARPVGPWVPVVQKEPEPTKLPVGTKVQSKNWARPYGHVVGYDEDLHMPIVKWDGTEDHGPEACKTDEFEVVK